MCIERKNRERMIKVSCVVGKDGVLSEVVEGAQQQLNQMDIPGEMTYNIGGSWEDQQEAFADMKTLMVLIVLLVYIVMAAQFESFTYPFVIMFSIPFAFTGVFIGLAVTNTPLGVMALVGLLMLIGIVVKNGIVLIDYTILCRLLCQLPHAVFQFAAAAVAERQGEGDAVVGSGEAAGFRQLVLAYLRQVFQMPDGVETHVVFHQLGHLAADGGRHQPHERLHLVLRTVPVFGGKSVQGEVRDAQFSALLHDATHRFHPFAMPHHAVHAALLRPPPVAVHDDGDVTRHLIRL